ncbi:MAG: C40 family peptidase [Gorillibacterium sp.]|nr:C40 family peptidase [Gorillibacterium sp.]
MKEIKTKTTVKDIKALDKTVDVSRRAKNAFIRTKEQAEPTQQKGHDSFVEYAEDKTKKGADTLTNKAGLAMGRQGKKAVQRMQEHRNSPSDTHHVNTANGSKAEQVSRPEIGNPRTGRSDVPSKRTQSSSTKIGKTPESYPVQAEPSPQQKAVPFKTKGAAKRKYTLAKPNELAKRRFIQGRVKARLSRSSEMQIAASRPIRSTEVKPALPVQKSVSIFKPAEKITGRIVQTNIHGAGHRIKQSAPSGSKTVKEGTKGTIKIARKSVKTIEHTAKTTVKTAQAVAKTTVKTAQATTKAAQRTAQAAKAAQRTAQAVRAATIFTIRMVKLAIKAAAALVKGLMLLVGTSGAFLALFLIIIAVAALISSPFGIFFSSDNKDAEVKAISSVVQEVNDEFSAKIEDIKNTHSDVDSVEIHYSGSADNIRVDNWMDVIAVFAVKTATDTDGGMDVATIDTTRIAMIKSVFWDMNLMDYYVETIEHSETETVQNEDGTTSTKTITTYEHILHITITSKAAEQQAEEYGFTDDQKDMLEEMLSNEFRPMMYALLGMDSDTGLTPEELQNLYHDLPEGELGSEAVRLALSRLGDPYSQPKAGQGDYTDCSYLVQWAYRQLGIALPRTAAAQAEYLMGHELTISLNSLVPGDLVFFSYETNGRFMNITHVGIYAGNGMIVDASSSKGQVVYRKLFDGDKQVLYARPDA